MQTQERWILNELKAGKRLTAIDALNGCGCFRLGARIYDLRAAGHKIGSNPITTASGKRIAEYFYIF